MVPYSLRLSSIDKSIDSLAHNHMATRCLELLSKAMPRPITTSSYSYDFPASIRVWRKSYNSSWDELNVVYRQMLADSLAGITLAGYSICKNHNGELDEELCMRWYQMASVGTHFQISSNSTPDKFQGFTQRCMIATLNR